MNQQSAWKQKLSSLPAAVKAAFLSCLVLGLAIHLFAFTNIIPNSDGLSRVYDAQQMTVSGRWFLHYASGFHGFLQAPSLIGILSLIFLAISAAMIADLLKLRRVSSGIFCAGALTAIPALAYTYLYMFTASAYAFAILLSTASVWLLRRTRWGFFPAVLLLACSLGTYQAYFSIAVALCLMCAIFDLLDSEKPVGATVRSGLLSLAMLAAAALVYVILLKVFLTVKDLELLEYRGIRDSSQGLALTTLLLNILRAYKQIISYFLLPAFSNPLLTLGNWAILVLGAAGGILLLCSRRPEPARLALLILGLFLMPLACNVTRLISEVSPNMAYSFACLYLFAAAILDRVDRPVLMRLEGVTAALIILGGAQIANLAYISSATAHRATQTFATNLVARVEQTPGYQRDMDVLVIGPFPSNYYTSAREIFAPVEHYSCDSNTVITRNKHVYYYLNTWLNVPWPEPSEDVMQAVSDSELFQSMPLYPSDGSVRIDGDRVIVKLADRYTPKQPYEIAYEHRR